MQEVQSYTPSISIHALREEGDSKNRDRSLCFCFSIHGFAQNGKRLRILLRPERLFLCEKPQGTWCEAPGNLCLLPGRTGSENQGVSLRKGGMYADVLHF